MWWGGGGNQVEMCPGIQRVGCRSCGSREVGFGNMGGIESGESGGRILWREVAMWLKNVGKWSWVCEGLGA